MDQFKEIEVSLQDLKGMLKTGCELNPEYIKHFKAGNMYRVCYFDVDDFIDEKKWFKLLEELI